MAIWIIAIAYLPLVIGIGASLHRIADAMTQQNKHYGIPASTTDAKDA